MAGCLLPVSGRSPENDHRQQSLHSCPPNSECRHLIFEAPTVAVSGTFHWGALSLPGRAREKHPKLERHATRRYPVGDAIRSRSTQS